MVVLETIHEPSDLQSLDPCDLEILAIELRQSIVRTVRERGGHLGSNLGVVELTIALHRVCDSPRNKIVWDIGHQTYPHKLLTGRRDEFESTLRTSGGLSGYPAREESFHDVIENSHASTALAYAFGLANDHPTSSGGRVIAVVGDGALTGGLAWEALNNLGHHSELPVTVVVNDNGRSYAPTSGGLANHLVGLQQTAGTTTGTNLFETLGLRYLGPVDGHDVGRLEHGLRDAMRGGVSILHVLTHKGRGNTEAEDDEVDRLHTVSPAATSTSGPQRPTWTSVFSDELVRAGHRDGRVHPVTAAMAGPTGLTPFAERFPGRIIDVGIAEQCAVATATGLAMAGRKPVVALYATFLNRAFDQVLLDAGLHGCNVTFVLDRAGATGEDGASHNGMWDLALLRIVPGLRIVCPRDEGTLIGELRAALDQDDGPVAIRFPKGRVPQTLPVCGRLAGGDVLFSPPSPPLVLIIGIGPMAEPSVHAAAALQSDGIPAVVLDPRRVSPVHPDLHELVRDFAVVVTVEDGIAAGGAGSAMVDHCRHRGGTTVTRTLGLPHRYLAHGTRVELLTNAGLTPEGIRGAVLEAVAETPAAPARD